MKTILAPLDFSPTTAGVVAEATSLALGVDAEVVLVHVLQAPEALADYGTAGGYLVALLDTLGRDATRHLAKWSRRVEARGARVRAVQLSGGTPSLLIAAEAKRRSADYIVMGTHGHTAFHELLAGSTTSGVLRRAPCPVVVVPARRAGPRRR